MYEHRGILGSKTSSLLRPEDSTAPSERDASAPRKLANAARSGFMPWKPVVKPLPACHCHKGLKRRTEKGHCLQKLPLKDLPTPHTGKCVNTINIIAHRQRIQAPSKEHLSFRRILWSVQLEPLHQGLCCILTTRGQCSHSQFACTAWLGLPAPA